MSESDVPEVITRSARSLAAQKRWDNKRMSDKQEIKMEKKKIDWSVLIAIAAVVVPVACITIGCYVGIVSSIKDVCIGLEKVRSELSHDIYDVRLELTKTNAEIDKIKTLMVVKELVPKEAFVRNDEVSL